MIKVFGKTFLLSTDNSSYLFRILPTGQAEHLHYGSKITIDKEEDALILTEKHVFEPGNAIVYDRDHKEYSLEDMRLEMSGYGKGDIREPFVEITHADGNRSCDFVYDSYEIRKNKHALTGLPSSYADTEMEELKVVFKEKDYGLKLELYYAAFEKENVITRSSRLINESEETVKVERLMSAQIAFDTSGYTLTTFNGAWAREMHRNDVKLSAGRYVNASATGTSSSRSNPFVMLSRPGCREVSGYCYGMNLIYSGNHYEAFEVGAYGKLRAVTGINPAFFDWELAPGASFDSPEAVLTYSNMGYGLLSRQMSDFVNDHIVRGKWRRKERPVLLNSWEASYFDINENKLLRLARAGKEVGIELFVMDDGWFGERNDDSSSLGDWEVNAKKLPHGLKGICDSVNALGMDFGIWVEPEMVSENSELYRAHPDWAMAVPGRYQSEGRNQKILDLTRTEVQDYIIEAMTKVFSSANISYVKWDMNRIFSDVYSSALPADRQGEVAHRYVLGLYRCMKTLTERFPEILFEGCAAGGNRFDLGILCYFPQIWASDDTDAVCRSEIQNGYSYGYPQSVYTAHVSAVPNHQTLRITPLQTRFSVASFAVLGYECNLCDMKKDDLEQIKAQITLYKSLRKTFQYGTLYRAGLSSDMADAAMEGMYYASNGVSAYGSAGYNSISWTVVSPDKKCAIGMMMQKLVQPNVQFSVYYPCGLDKETRYHFYNRALKINVREFGDLVNTIAPIHIRQDSGLHYLLSKFVKLDGETEDLEGYGNTLMEGVHLHPAYGGTGFSDQVRHYSDFGSRMYFMEAIEHEKSN